MGSDDFRLQGVPGPRDLAVLDRFISLSDALTPFLTRPLYHAEP